MENMVLTEELIQEALKILDIQRSYVTYKYGDYEIPVAVDESKNREQSAYYEGMFMMLDMIVSKNFTGNLSVDILDNNTHIITNDEDGDE